MVIDFIKPLLPYKTDASLDSLLVKALSYFEIKKKFVASVAPVLHEVTAMVADSFAVEQANRFMAEKAECLAKVRDQQTEIAKLEVSAHQMCEQNTELHHKFKELQEENAKMKTKDKQKSDEIRKMQLELSKMKVIKEKYDKMKLIFDQ